jgi:hypothetical protein
MSRLRKVESFEDFVEDLHKKSPTDIVVQANSRFRSGWLLFTPRTFTAGRMGRFQYGLHYAVQQTRRGVSYFEPIFEVNQTEYGILDEDLRKKRMISTMLAGEARVELLRAELPHTNVSMIGEDNQPMSAEDIQILHLVAGQHQLDSALNHVQAP